MQLFNYYWRVFDYYFRRKMFFTLVVQTVHSEGQIRHCVQIFVH